MFRFVLQAAFVRRVLAIRFVRVAIVVVLLGSVAAGVLYTALVLRAVNERNNDPHVQHHSVR